MGTVQKAGRIGPRVSGCRIHPQGFQLETHFCGRARRRLGLVPDRLATRSRAATAPTALVPERFVSAGPFRAKAGASLTAKLAADLPGLCADHEVADHREA